MSQKTAPGMWPSVYDFGLTSPSTTRPPGSSRGAASQAPKIPNQGVNAHAHGTQGSGGPGRPREPARERGDGTDPELRTQRLYVVQTLGRTVVGELHRRLGDVGGLHRPV